jgi:hypothetical protein
MVALSSSLTLALPAAIACSLASGVQQQRLDGQPDSPTDDVVVVVGLVGQFFTVTTSHISDVVIMDQDDVPLDVAGDLTIRSLPCTMDLGIPYAKPCPSYVLWRPREPMPPGDYSLSMAVRQERVRSDDGPLIATQRFTVRADAQRVALAPPEIDARLSGFWRGRDEVCCTSTTLSVGPQPDYGACIPDDNLERGVAEPPMGQLQCPRSVGEACELCWPTRFAIAPQLAASWRQPDQAPVYYEVALESSGFVQTISTGASKLYEPSDNNTRYCVYVTAVSLINGERAAATKCVERSALVEPAPLLAPVERPLLCEPEPDLAADGAGDDAGGGCATAPGAPAGAAPLWLLGALWAVRRRTDGRRAR